MRNFIAIGVVFFLLLMLVFELLPLLEQKAKNQNMPIPHESFPEPMPNNCIAGFQDSSLGRFCTDDDGFQYFKEGV